MAEDRTTVHNFRLLRVSLARIAEKLEFELSTIPGAPPSWRYEDLWQATLTEDGWQGLCHHILARVERIMEAVELHHHPINQPSSSDSTPEQVSDSLDKTETA